MPLLNYDDALRRVLDRRPPLADETVALERALGRVLRHDVTADRDQPPFHRSAMDGFAVRSAEVNATPAAPFPIDGSVAAGADAVHYTTPLKAGCVRRIATGAPLPVGADATIPIESCTLEGTGGNARVKFNCKAIEPMQNIHPRAADAAAGEAVLRAGTCLAPHHLGIAAAVGASTLRVSAIPRISIITTGDEVVPHSTANLPTHQIRNSNGPMLVSILHTLGAPPLHHEHVPDDPEITLAAAREALSHSQIVVTNGGISAGERDFLPHAWKHLGLETVLHGVNIQPGKPVFVAADDCKLVLGLPGNPVSVLCTAHLFLWPLLCAMTGRTEPTWRPLRLAEPTKATAKRQLFRAATILPDHTARIIPWHGSGDLIHTAAADVWLRMPISDQPIDAGTALPSIPMIAPCL